MTRARAQPPMGRGTAFSGVSFGGAFNMMKDLMNEYNEITLDSIDDLLQQTIQQVAQKLKQFIKERNYDRFNQIIGVLEKELKKINDNQNQDEEYYYDEDKDYDDEEEEAEESKDLQ